MRISSTRKSRYYRYAAILMLAVFLVSFSLIAINLYERNHGKFPNRPTVEKVIEYNGVMYKPKKGLDTFVVIGLDGKDTDAYKDDVQADFILIFVIDKSAKTVTPIQINRDTIVKMNVLGLGNELLGTVEQQIALSYNYGSNGKASSANTIAAVSNLLHGVKLNYKNYLSVTMEGVPVLNDLVGGVTVESLVDMGEGDDAIVKGQTVTLTGKQALDYVQARADLEDKTNVARMERQRQYLSALREKTAEKLYKNGSDEVDSEFAAELITTMSEYFVSGLRANELQTFLETLSAYEFTEMLELEGTSEIVTDERGNELMAFKPHHNSVTEVVVKAFYQESDN